MKKIVILSAFLLNSSFLFCQSFGQNEKVKFPLYHKGEIIGEIDTVHKDATKDFYWVVVTLKEGEVVRKNVLTRAVNCALYERFNGCSYCIFIKTEEE